MWQTYEEPILIKLGLSRKFPQTGLHSRKSSLNVRLMFPSAIITILKLKLYIRNKRKLVNAEDSITIQEEYYQIEA